MKLGKGRSRQANASSPTKATSDALATVIDNHWSFLQVALALSCRHSISPFSNYAASSFCRVDCLAATAQEGSADDLGVMSISLKDVV